MVVGYQLRYAELERCHNFAIHTTIEMPRRAAELKSAIVTIARQYFRCV